MLSPDEIAQVDALLRESMQKHEAARMARNKRGPNANQLLSDAYRLRLEALAMDPKRETSAWTGEVERLGRDLHGDLMKFYESKVLTQ